MPRARTCNCGSCLKCKRREYMRRWYQSKSPAERRAMIAQRDSERVRRADRERYHRQKGDPEYAQKRRAREAVNNAIRDGRMVRGSCEVCGAPDAQAHHDDYDKPLVVRWLCSAHHAAVHAF